MNAGQVAELVAPFINESANLKNDRLYRIIKMAANFAWANGKWFGMLSEFFLESFVIDGKRYIHAPRSNEHLVAININGMAQNLRDLPFMFHRNGPGDPMSSCYAGWSRNVYDVGQFPLPTLINNYQLPVTVGIRSLGQAGDDEFAFVRGAFGQDQIYSYKSSSGSKCNCLSIDAPESIETIYGAKIPISREFTYYRNLSFTDIEYIGKTKTRCPIEICLIGRDNVARVVGILAPHETELKYRRYMIPDGCSHTIHGLFKISQQGDIFADTQPLILKASEAVWIALAKGINLKYFGETIDAGEAYLQDGLRALELENREIMVPEAIALQVDGLVSVGMDEIFKHF